MVWICTTTNATTSMARHSCSTMPCSHCHMQGLSTTMHKMSAFTSISSCVNAVLSRRVLQHIHRCVTQQVNQHADVLGNCAALRQTLHQAHHAFKPIIVAFIPTTCRKLASLQHHVLSDGCQPVSQVSIAIHVRLIRPNMTLCTELRINCR